MSSTSGILGGLFGTTAGAGGTGGIANNGNLVNHSGGTLSQNYSGISSGGYWTITGIGRSGGTFMNQNAKPLKVGDVLVAWWDEGPTIVTVTEIHPVPGHIRIDTPNGPCAWDHGNNYTHLDELSSTERLVWNLQ